MFMDAIFSPATQNTSGTSGGTAILWRSYLDVVPMAPHAHMRHGIIQGTGHDWSAVIWRTKGVNILIGVAYMTCGIGFQGENINKFLELTKLIRHYKMPFIILGDWNMEPQAIPVHWLRKHSARIATPPGLVGTCSQGSNRMLDWAIFSECLEQCITIEPDLDG